MRLEIDTYAVKKKTILGSLIDVGGALINISIFSTPSPPELITLPTVIVGGGVIS